MSKLGAKITIKPCTRENIPGVLRTGRRFEGQYVSIRVGPVPGSTKPELFWAAVVNTKQLPRAVDRHRFKRIVRETIRKSPCGGFSGHAIVVLLRLFPTPISWPDISKEIQQLLLAVFRGS